MRQKYFAVYEEYANRHKIKLISKNFRPKKKKIMIQKIPSPNMIEWAKNHLTLLSL
jgi:hypothetical protein